MEIHRFFVAAPRGLVPVVAEELGDLGARSVSEDTGGCRVRGPLSFGYKLCLWSRCATRVLLPLREVVAADVESLHAQIAEMPWEEHIDPEGTIAVDYAGRGAGIEHTKYGAQRVKDAIVDRLRAATGRRPSVDAKSPDVLINAYARGKSCTLAIDLAGGSLHRRGYRSAAGPAPLKENLAAAMLRLAGWHRMPDDAPLVDPCCGSGTLVIEAALMRANIPPGIFRERFGFERWLKHDAEAWNALLSDARAGRKPTGDLRLAGWDAHPRAIELAQQAAERAGVDDLVHLEQGTIDAVPAPTSGPGLVVANPPFGERMGEKSEARRVYAQLGQRLRAAFDGWTSCILASDDDLLPLVGVVPESSHEVMAGPIEARIGIGVVRSPQGDLVNRLRKNMKRLAKWRKREGIAAYRLYDADIPEYAAAIDVYGSAAVVSEYAPPAEIDPDKAASRRIAMTVAVADVLDIPLNQVHLKSRKRQRGSAQYEKLEPKAAWTEVEEGDLDFRVNLSDYLDTGLFIDHRRARAMIGKLARGKSFLNLYGYTGTASVYAAFGGALSTTTVDLSNTYLEWAKENFVINDLLGPTHRFIKADVQAWLESEQDLYDLIFLDPPTFSNSKAMRSTLDLRRDHAGLIRLTAARLAPGGTLLFSTNAKGFKLDPALAESFEVQEITRETLSPDFERKPLHRAWKIRHAGTED